jgi:RNA-binding protein
LTTLSGFQRKHLRGLAHSLQPVVLVGQKGATDALFLSVDEALDQHELIKIKFNDFKDKADKKEISAQIQDETGCELVGMIGHTAIFYRQHEDPAKRRIRVPQRAED